MLYQVTCMRYIMIKKLFTFWKQKEKTKIHWWTTIEGVEKVTPVLPAKEFIPDWWKRVQRKINSLDDKGTVRNCPSFREYINQGFVVALWCDLYLEIEQEGTWKWRTPDKNFSFSTHSNTQFRDWLPQHMQDNTSMVVKPSCPWRVKTPPGWSVWQLPMYYHYNPMFETLPGIIWSDIHHEINQQMLFKRYGEFFIPRGTPLAMYVPFERNKYTYDISGPNSTNAAWSNESFLHVRSKFKGGYKLHQAEVKKCPVKH